MSTPVSLEETVGITEFLHPELSSITGILKQRFSDFIVREVTTEDEVLFLRDISGAELEQSIFAKEEPVPEKEEEGKEDVPVEEKLFAALLAAYGLPSESIDTDASAIASSLPEDPHSGTIASLREFLAKSVAREEDCASEWVGFPTADKTVRSSLHQRVREIAGAALDSTTVTFPENANSYVKLIAKHKMRGGKGAGKGQGQAAFVNSRKRKLDAWPEKECGGNYLEFTMLKENIDTMSAINVLSKALHTKPEYILYNGTKDKRGVTTQKVTVYRRKPSDFKKINAYPHLPTIRVGDFRYVKQPAKLGQLNGNRFEITLRAVQCVNENNNIDEEIEDRTIELACEYLKSHGFLNYFGLQRFGKGGSKSHEIGRAIFQSNWKECVERLFTPRENDRDNVRRAKEHFFAGEYSKAASLLPEAMYSEKCVLRKLSQSPDDWQAAYHAIGNKGSRLICAHAYQSYIFNLAASKRVKEFGLSVVAGDLVIPRANEALLAQAEEDEENIEKVVESAEDGADSTNKKNKKDAAPTTASDVLHSLVHVVTEEEAVQNVFSLDEVVLPLSGSESVLPTHSVGAFIVDLLTKDNLSLKTFAQCFPTYRMRGSYRKLIQKAGNVEWSIQRYSDPHAELAETELSKFRAPREPAAASTAAGDCEGEADKKKELKLKALNLKFTLPPGTYATMLLREVTKQSTESDFQAQLTANVDKKE